MIKPEDEIRIAIRVRVTDLPGDPNRRDVTLGELFSEKVLFRPIKPVTTVDGYDGVVLMGGFNSKNPVDVWFIYDLNVRGKKTREELLATPHKVYTASKHNDDWVFVPKDSWIDTVKTKAKMYSWGGKTQQEELANMRNDLTMA